MLPLKLPSMDWAVVAHLGRSDACNDVATIWRPVGAPRYFCIGDVLRKGREPPSTPATMYLKNPQVEEGSAAAFAFPESYHLVWREFGVANKKKLTLWRAQPPPGYAAIGSMASERLEPPARTAMVCVREVRCFAPTLAE